MGGQSWKRGQKWQTWLAIVAWNFQHGGPPLWLQWEHLPNPQDTNRVGATLYCTYRYKVFILCYNARTPITLFPDVSDDIALGWEYLYHSPHKFGAFVLC